METITDRLRMALKDAIRQCREHNSEYHHRTPDQMLLEWAALVSESDTAATPPLLNGNAARRRLTAPSWQPLETAPAGGGSGKQQMLLFKGHSKAGTFEGNVYVSGWVDGDGEPIYDYKYKLKITGWKALEMVDDETS
jgi:hypothetical protein